MRFGRSMTAAVLQSLQQMREMMQRNSFTRPNPKPYGNPRSRYMPHIGDKQRAKAALALSVA